MTLILCLFVTRERKEKGKRGGKGKEKRRGKKIFQSMCLDIGKTEKKEM